MPLRANTPGIPEGYFFRDFTGRCENFFFHTGNKWSAKSLCLHYPQIFAKDNYLNNQVDKVTYINLHKTAYWSFYLANIYVLFRLNIVLSALNNVTCLKLHCYCASIIICIWWYAFGDMHLVICSLVICSLWPNQLWEQAIFLPFISTVLKFYLFILFIYFSFIYFSFLFLPIFLFI